VIFCNNKSRPDFTRPNAKFVEEDGAFTSSVRIFNHLKQEEAAWGQETAATFDMASLMVGSLANQFSIPESGISIKIVMRALSRWNGSLVENSRRSFELIIGRRLERASG
jgi:hypothetical protein